MSDNINKSLIESKQLLGELIDQEIVDFPELSAEQLSKFNAKDIVVMVNYTDGNFPKPESELLGGIYNALKLDRTQTNFIDLGKQPMTFKDAAKILGTKNFILFGINPEDIRLHINLRPYQIVKVGECQLIFSHKLADLVENKSYKGALWASLKVMFNIQ